MLAPGVVYRGGQVAVDSSGTVACVGCDCASYAVAATVVSCPRGVVSPGLINTHDHITFSQNGPFVDTGERYEQRQDWRRGLGGHTQLSAPAAAGADQVAWVELRFMMAGATSTLSSGGHVGFLRNLDVASDLEGIPHDVARLDTFPLGDSLGSEIVSG